MEADRAARLRPHLHHDDRRPRARRHAVPPDVELHHRDPHQPDRRSTLDTVGGTPIQEGGTYGVGTVVVARFDEPVDNKANAERHLVVTTNPPVHGSWYWLDDQTAHWRPEKYYAPGTSVTVSANIYGAPLGDGLYGQQDEHVSFKIGDSHVSIADDNTKQVSVYENGKLVRTMPTSMGMGGTETIGGTTLSFWTPPGVYTVMDKANPVIMDSSTFGLPINSRLGYRVTIPYATRISTDGIYLHQLNATVWAQGNTNTSHGCLNLNGENAKWFYGFSMPGDVVEVRNTGGQPLQLSQNGDWSVPWDRGDTEASCLEPQAGSLTGWSYLPHEVGQPTDSNCRSGRVPPPASWAALLSGCSDRCVCLDRVHVVLIADWVGLSRADVHGVDVGRGLALWAGADRVARRIRRAGP